MNRRCYFCGKFIAYHESQYRWTPYGGAMDFEPPDEEFAHSRCYETYDKKELLINTSWLKPSLMEVV